MELAGAGSQKCSRGPSKLGLHHFAKEKLFFCPDILGGKTEIMHTYFLGPCLLPDFGSC